MTMINNGTAILERLIHPDEATLSADAARSFLQLDFPARDHARVKTLSAKAQAGTLTGDEKSE